MIWVRRRFKAGIFKPSQATDLANVRVNKLRHWSFCVAIVGTRQFIMVGATASVVGTMKSLRDKILSGFSAEISDVEPQADTPFQQIGAFLQLHDIDPSPDHYALAYRHFIAGEAGLEEQIAELIRSGNYSGNASETCPFKSQENHISENELTEMADAVHEQLKALEGLIVRSSAETRGFNNALQDSAALVSPGMDVEAVIGSLMSLTRSMVDKTRVAEEELRLRGEAMTDLRMCLSEACLKADTDALTGLSNRRAFERALGAAAALADSSGEPLSLAICDIDNFKSVNDRFGHETGDRVLKFVGRILENHCGASGQVARFGGEEFVVLFSGLCEDRAFELVDAARHDISGRNIVKKETQEPMGSISFSAGIGTYAVARDSSNLLRIADRALYAAKANGRNCVFLSNH
jgi:diguanylate cyclase